jgi:hypothetical protein
MVYFRRGSWFAFAMLLVTGWAATAWAATIAYTTIPDSSGLLSCNGLNADGTTATWTNGGSIGYTSVSGAHYYQGYRNITPSANGNVTDPDFYGCSTVQRLTTQSNVKANCSLVDFECYLAYKSYPNATPNTLWSAGGSVVPPANTTAVFENDGNFSALYDVKEIQFKCKAAQNQLTPALTWTAATPYL